MTDDAANAHPADGLSAGQVRGARALLGWMSPMLAHRARISFDKAFKAQDDARIGALSSMELQAIRAAFEDAGVRFTLDAQGQPGAVLVTSP